MNVTIRQAGGAPVTLSSAGAPVFVLDAGGVPVTLVDNGPPLALLNPDGTPWSSTPQAMQFVATGGANDATASITGVLAGDLIVGTVNRGSSGTLPTFDSGGGRERIDNSSWIGSTQMCAIAFAKIAESTTPSFGTHTNGSRCTWWAFRFDVPLANALDAIGASTYLWASGSDTTAPWAGLTLTKTTKHVVTIMHRVGNELIVARPTDYADGGNVGVSARYRWGRSSGEVSSWPQRDVTQTVNGYEGCISIEVGF